MGVTPHTPRATGAGHEHADVGFAMSITSFTRQARPKIPGERREAHSRRACPQALTPTQKPAMEGGNATKANSDARRDGGVVQFPQPWEAAYAITIKHQASRLQQVSAARCSMAYSTRGPQQNLPPQKSVRRRQQTTDRKTNQPHPPRATVGAAMATRAFEWHVPAWASPAPSSDGAIACSAPHPTSLPPLPAG